MAGIEVRYLSGHDVERLAIGRGLATTDIALGHAILQRAIEQEVGAVLPYR
jgi:hypothetical protein